MVGTRCHRIVTKPDNVELKAEAIVVMKTFLLKFSDPIGQLQQSAKIKTFVKTSHFTQSIMLASLHELVAEIEFFGSDF